MKIPLTKNQLENIGGNLWLDKKRWWVSIWFIISVFAVIPFLNATPKGWWRWFIYVPLISLLLAFIVTFIGVSRARKNYAKTHVGWIEDAEQTSRN